MSTNIILPGFTLPGAAPASPSATFTVAGSFGDILSALTSGQNQGGQQKTPASPFDLPLQVQTEQPEGNPSTAEAPTALVPVLPPDTTVPVPPPALFARMTAGKPDTTQAIPYPAAAAAVAADPNKELEPLAPEPAGDPGAALQAAVIPSVDRLLPALAAAGQQAAAQALPAQHQAAPAPLDTVPGRSAPTPEPGPTRVQTPAPVVGLRTEPAGAPALPSAVQTPFPNAAAAPLAAPGPAPAPAAVEVTGPAHGALSTVTSAPLPVPQQTAAPETLRQMLPAAAPPAQPAVLAGQDPAVQPSQPLQPAAPGAVADPAPAARAATDLPADVPAGPVQPALPAVTEARGTAPATAAPAPAAPSPAQPMAAQLVRPLFTLATEAPGEHVMTLKVSPEDLGPVTVRAHISADGVRLELFATGDAGRDAVRHVLPDLRRELAQQGLTASLDLSGRDTPGQGQQQGGHQRGGHDPNAPYRPNLRMVTEAEPVPGQTVRTHTSATALDVVA